MTKPRAVTLLRVVFWAAVLLSFVVATVPQPLELPGNPSDKLLHMAAFAALTLLGALAYPRLPLLKLALALSAFGAGIELVQGLPAVGRHREFLDWVADSAAVAAVILVLLWRRRTEAS
jgi:hypothetical protein